MSPGRLFLLIFVALLLPGAYASAGGGIPLIVTVNGSPAVGCTLEGLMGDLGVNTVGCTTKYEDGTSCSDPITCIPLRVQLISNSKTLALDTRGTEGPRKLIIDFTACKSGCGGMLPSGTVSDILATPGLLEVLLRSPFTSISIGTFQDGVAKFWFTDNSGLSWRIDWPSVTVTPVVGGWKIIPNEIALGVNAGLSLLTGQRTKPGTIGTDGFYSIPFLLDAKCQSVC